MRPSIRCKAARNLRAAICILSAWFCFPALAAEPDALTKAILGDWIKNGEEVITLYIDGTFKGGRSSGTWQWINKEDRRFEIDHGKLATYILTLSADGSRATGKVDKGEPDKIGKPIVFVRKSMARSAGETTPAAPVPFSPPSAVSTQAQLTAADLVKAHRNNLVFVSGTNGSGSGFLAKYGNRTFLFTNAHVAAGVQGAGFKTLQGDQVPVGTPSVAVGHDIFLMQATPVGQPLEIMTGVDENTSIGDDIVVLGNAEGAGVINTIMGKIVGVGPQLVEVDAPFKPGNSGSPIIHLKTGKVIGAATYLTIRKFDSATNQPAKEPIVRRFGYRLDSVKKWQPVQWPALFAQAKEMDTIEALTEDLVTFLNDLADSKVNSSLHTNPVIKNRIDAWLAAKMRGLSPRDRQSADQSFISFLKVTCQSDITAARARLTYDYFQRALDEQQKQRTQIADIFDKIIKDIQKTR